jgi:hypothetical protein
MVIKDSAMPIMVGLVLYLNLNSYTIRNLLAFSSILASYHFMTVMSRLPKVGLYVHMLTKVMGTVLNFFLTYTWHFLGYAIAFNIMMPGNGAFANFFDSFIKVTIEVY